MLLRQRHGVAIEVEIHPLRGRVRGVGDDQHRRRRRGVLHRAADAGEVRLRRQGRDVPDDAACDDEAIGVDGIGGIGADDDIARRGQGLGEVGKAFLRTQCRHNLGVGVELHAKALGIVSRHRAAQARNALGRRVAPRLRIPRRLDQLVDNVLGRRHVGIAHAEVDDVRAFGPKLALEAVHLLEDIGRQAPDLVEFLGLGKGQGRQVRASASWWRMTSCTMKLRNFSANAGSRWAASARARSLAICSASRFGSAGGRL